MFLKVVDRFVKKAPVAVLFRGLFARTFDANRMNRIFRDHRECQVEGDLVFSKLLDLLTPVVLGSQPTVCASHRANEEEIGVSRQAVYDKLRGVEWSVSEALVREPAADLVEILKKERVKLEDPIPGYQAFIIDGKRLDGSEHRIRETRAISNAPLPGTVLAVLDTRTKLFVDVACSPDGHACERKVVAPLLDRLQKGCVYIADRNFSDGPTIAAFLKAGTYFVLRQHKRSPVCRSIAECEKITRGKDSLGGSVSEEAIEVRLSDGTWKRVRRITIRLTKPTRDNQRVVHLLTNLPDSVSALTIADAYRHRWTIETCLGHLAKALNAEINTLAYPKAALLCFCLALVAYNFLSAVSGLLTQTSKSKKKPQISLYYLAIEVATASGGLAIMTDVEDWERFSKISLDEFCSWANSVAQRAKIHKYRASPRGPKRPTPKRKQLNKTTHISTHKLLLDRPT